MSVMCIFFFFKQKTAYEMRISDWSSDVCSSDLTMLPLLVLIADIIGVFGGYIVSTQKLGFNPEIYLKNTWDFIQAQDVISGLVKAAVFGFLVTLMGCYHGYNSRGGAQGVGTATTNAVVSASILILSFNYFITELFFAR